MTEHLSETKRAFPIIEVFGPTIQGEGALAGAVTHFLRTGGCDYRCSWCDTMYAVDPVQVREHAEKLTAGEIEGRLHDLGPAPWVTISGGNPALLQLGGLVADLQEAGYKVAVETQASVWRDWLWAVDLLTCSPKPPSSGMMNPRHAAQTERFMHYAAHLHPSRRCLKIVVFDDLDLRWARDFIDVARPETDRHSEVEGEEWTWPTYLSVGTDMVIPKDMHPEIYTLTTIAGRYRWLCEQVAADPALQHVRVLPQLHVLAWGQRRGV